MADVSKKASKRAPRYRFATEGEQRYTQERAAMIRCLQQHNYHCAPTGRVTQLKKLFYDAVLKEPCCAKDHPTANGAKVKPSQDNAITFADSVYNGRKSEWETAFNAMQGEGLTGRST